MIKLFKTIWNWLDDRLGISVLLSPMKHIAPEDSKWWYVFGSATLVAFIVQVATGVALAFSYISSSSQAYETLLFITNNAPFGRILRGLHYYGASAMVLPPRMKRATQSPIIGIRPACSAATTTDHAAVESHRSSCPVNPIPRVKASNRMPVVQVISRGNL